MYHPAVAVSLTTLEALARAPRPAAEVGGKALHLAELVAAGLPVPPGFVLAAACRADPGAIEAHAAGLGELLVVRSSASIEDGAERAAPGLFSSQLNIRPSAIHRAIAEVVASADRPAARAYLAGEPVSMAVIVQRQVAGQPGVLYTRAPVAGHDQEMWLEVVIDGAASVARATRGGELVRVDPDFPLGAERIAALVRLGLAAERAIGASRGADVEWVAAADALWLVQARPRTQAPAPPIDPEIAQALAFSRGDPRLWRWDASHNPDPLSPAQQGLVDLVADLGDQEMRVVAGYLYSAPRPIAPPAVDAAELFARSAAPAMERALAPVEGAEPPRLDDALAAYREVVAVYAGELAPALRAAGHPASPERSAVAQALAAGAAHPLAPAWDVAAPTFGEDEAMLARARARAPASTGSGAPAIREADDLYFFRAQRVVRRALLALADRWRIGDDIFYLPLRLVCRSERVPDDAATVAGRLRAERRRQRARAMPLAFRDGAPAEPIAPPRAPDLWRGRPAGGGSVRGPVAILGDLGHLDRDPRGAVIVAASVSPATLVQLVGAVGLICEQDGALGHAAALARELRLPCVVGCAGITRALEADDQVLVDGDAGLVVRLRGLGDD
jgi:phosphohistidine swiveling domain-containing protein